MNDWSLSQFLLCLPPLILAITLHEAAHAFVARFFGDNAAHALGRVSLNPIRHIDPIGTIILPLVLWLLPFVNFIFGWAKPVPINPQAYQSKHHLALVALAGPVSNFLMALLWFLILIINVHSLAHPALSFMAQIGILLNFILAFFNLLPILPLDGGRILALYLPRNITPLFALTERFGLLIVVGLFLLGVLGPLIFQPSFVLYRQMLSLAFSL